VIARVVTSQQIGVFEALSVLASVGAGGAILFLWNGDFKDEE
jgi:hypothetical protein